MYFFSTKMQLCNSFYRKKSQDYVENIFRQCANAYCSSSRKWAGSNHIDSLARQRKSTYCYNIQSVVTDFADLSILIMHQVYKICWSLWEAMVKDVKLILPQSWILLTGRIY